MSLPPRSAPAAERSEVAFCLLYYNSHKFDRGAMEIEAKFAVPNEKTFARLQAIEQLAGYALSASKTKQVLDTFLDTPDRVILRSGHVCRRRQVGDQIIMTLKSGHTIEGAVHRREELEVTLLHDLPIAQWPDSEIRDRLMTIVGDVALLPLFDQHQTRIVRMMAQGDRTVAEWSLDHVELSIGGKEQTYSEVEVELKEQGTEEDLATIAACLRNDWGLQPEPRSKFSRGLALLMGHG